MGICKLDVVLMVCMPNLCTIPVVDRRVSLSAPWPLSTIVLRVLGMVCWLNRKTTFGRPSKYLARCLRSRHAPAVGRDMDLANVLVASPMSARSWARNAARISHDLYADVSVLFNAGSDNRLSNSASVTLTPGMPVVIDFPVRPNVLSISGTCLASGSTWTNFRHDSSRPNLISRLKTTASWTQP